VGLTADALDDGVVATAEVANATAALQKVQIGNRRGEGDTPAGSDVILASPVFGTVMVKQIDDLGEDDGSVLWMGDADTFGQLRSQNSAVEGLNWTHRPGDEDPWPVTLEPILEIS